LTDEPHGAFVALGANVGDLPAQLKQAAQRLATHDQVVLKDVSSLWRTSPEGPVADQPDFVNAVILLETLLTPQGLLAFCHEVEEALGRDRSREVSGGPRPIDLDLLAYGDVVLDEEGLTLPHPRLAERAFVLEPLHEVAPHFVHPATSLSVGEMLSALPPGQRVERIGPLEVAVG
jgi:2-amino-4-hydroxy-6-hydroxymethyldihydropteridine diphosphokinase